MVKLHANIERRRHTVYDTLFSPELDMRESDVFFSRKSDRPGLGGMCQLFGNRHVGRLDLTSLTSGGMITSDSDVTSHIHRMKAHVWFDADDATRDSLYGLIASDTAFSLNVGCRAQWAGHLDEVRAVEPGVKRVVHVIQHNFVRTIQVPSRQNFDVYVNLTRTVLEAVRGFKGRKLFRVFLDVEDRRIVQR